MSRGLLCTDTVATALGRIGDFGVIPIVGDTPVDVELLATAEVAYFSADPPNHSRPRVRSGTCRT